MMIVAVTRVIPVISGRSESHHRVDGQGAQPGQAEDVLRDDRAAEQDGEIQTGRRDDGRQAGAQRVLDDDRALAQALRPRRPDVVLAERLEHLVAGEAHVERRVQDREDDPRQDHRLAELDRVLERRDVPRERQQLHLMTTKKIRTRPMKNEGNE